MTCLFCSIIDGSIPAYKVYENDRVLAFLDIGPVSKGHTLVVPKRHATNLSEGSVEDSRALMDAIHNLAPKIMQALGASGYNLGMNHGESAGQEVMHTHVHLMPRYQGQERTFTKLKPSPEELAQVAEQIRAVV